MRLATLIRWTGPAAIGGGVFMIFSDLLGLTIYVPGLGEAAQTGYQAVGSGVILFALVMLLVGMVGLYAGKAETGGAKVLESGGGYPRRGGTEDLEEYLRENPDLAEQLRLLADRGVSSSRGGVSGREHRVYAASFSPATGQNKRGAK